MPRKAVKSRDPNLVRFDVRVPAEVHEAIVDFAEENERSMNREILVLLREALAARAKRRR